MCLTLYGRERCGGGCILVPAISVKRKAAGTNPAAANLRADSLVDVELFWLQGGITLKDDGLPCYFFEFVEPFAVG